MHAILPTPRLTKRVPRCRCLGSVRRVRWRIQTNACRNTCDWIDRTLLDLDLVSQVVPENLQIIISEWDPRSGLNSGPRSVCQHLCLLGWHQETASENLPSIVNGQVHMLPSLALSVQLDEALRAEEIDTIFA